MDSLPLFIAGVLLALLIGAVLRELICFARGVHPYGADTKSFGPLPPEPVRRWQRVAAGLALCYLVWLWFH